MKLQENIAVSKVTFSPSTSPWTKYQDKKLIWETTYFGLPIQIISGTVYNREYPYRFTVGKHQFTGIPNQCKTKLSALKRAWWRAKWISEDTFNERYK